MLKVRTTLNRIGSAIILVTTLGSAGAACAQAVKNPVVAGTMPKYPPFEFKDLETNEMKGFDIDFAEALVAKMGSKIKWEEVSFDQMISAITTGRANIVLSGITDSPERQESIDFLDYLATGPQFYTTVARAKEFPTPESLCGKRVATARRTGWPDNIRDWSTQHCTKAGKPDIIVVGTDGSPDTRLQLRQNRVDAAVQGSETLPYQNRLDNNAYTAIGKPFFNQLMGMGLSKKDPTLQNAAKAAFKKMLEDGTYKKIIDKWNLQDGALTKPFYNGKEY